LYHLVLLEFLKFRSAAGGRVGRAFAASRGLANSPESPCLLSSCLHLVRRINSRLVTQELRVELSRSPTARSGRNRPFGKPVCDTLR
jgi:hypothetical protein